MTTIRRQPDFKKNFYERLAWDNDQLICGIDEVGRGCLAGPVVTAAVILRTQRINRLIRDSKELSPEERLQAYKWIKANSWYATALVNHRIIEQINIYQATLKAMKRAFAQLSAQLSAAPSLVVVDAMPLYINSFQGDIIYFNYGESKSSSIAAASIVAKVTRDNLMARLSDPFPHYSLGQHKGYSTPQHKKSLLEHGASIIHRTTFIDHLKLADNPKDQQNETLLELNANSEQLSLL